MLSNANDGDCDGIVFSNDCDDNNPIVSTGQDADCDGVLTDYDCDDDQLIGSSTMIQIAMAFTMFDISSGFVIHAIDHLGSIQCWGADSAGQVSTAPKGDLHK